MLCADVSNVDTVLVAGQVRKRDGKLLADVDKARADGRRVARLPPTRGHADAKRQAQAAAEADLVRPSRCRWRALPRSDHRLGSARTPTADRYRRAGYSTVVGEDDHAVHTGFVISELDPGGSIPWHVHSFEESLYVLDGTGGGRQTPGGSFRGSEGGLRAGPDRHAAPLAQRQRRARATFEMQAPMPRSAHDMDTFVVPDVGTDRGPLSSHSTSETRATGTSDTSTPSHMDPVPAEPGPARGHGEHADRAARLQRDQRQDDGRF